MAGLVPTIRSDLRFESERLRDAGFEHYALMREEAAPSENARALMQFLDIPEDLAQELAQTDHLFAD